MGETDNSQTFTWTSDMSKMQSDITVTTELTKKLQKAIGKVIEVSSTGTVSTKDDVLRKLTDDLAKVITLSNNAKAGLSGLINSAKQPMSSSFFSERDVERMAFRALGGQSVGGGVNPSLSPGVHEAMYVANARVLRRTAAAERDEERAAWDRVRVSDSSNDPAPHIQDGSAGGGMMALRRLAGKSDMAEREKVLLKALSDGERDYAATMRLRSIAEEASVGTKNKAIAAEAAHHVELIKVARQMDENRQQIHAISQSTVGTAAERSKAMQALAEKNVVLGKRQRELNIAIEQGNGGLMRNRMMVQSMTYAVQDFVSGGGLHNLALGFRGATNNIEMMFMSMGRTMTPMQMMGFSLLPTAALAAVELAASLNKSEKATKDAGEQMKEYSEHVKRAKEEVEELTLKESAREKLRAQREGGKLIAEGVAQERQAHEEFREIEHNMNVWAGKEQVRGIGDALGVGWFGVKALARRAAKNAGQLGGNLLGRTTPLWRVDTVHDQQADAEILLRGARMQQDEGRQAAMDKELLVGNKASIKDEIRRQQRIIEGKEEEKHRIEEQRDSEVRGRNGRPLPRRRQREIEGEIHEKDDEIKSLRDKLKKFERAAEDNPGKSLEEVMKGLTAAILDSNRIMETDGGAGRMPNLLGNLQMIA